MPSSLLDKLRPTLRNSGVREAEVTRLASERYIDDHELTGEPTVKGLVDQVMKWRREAAPAATSTEPQSELPGPRLAQRQTMVEWGAWAHATQRDGVVDFRRRYVGPLLDVDAVSSWVAKQAAADGPARRVFGVTLDREPTVLPDKLDGRTYDTAPYGTLTPAAGRGRYQVVEVRHLDLFWPMNHNPETGFLGTGFTPVNPGGVLDELRLLSATLADDYGWDGLAATAFVLTGLRPAVRTISLRELLRPAPGRAEPHGTTALVQITVDASMPPELLAAIYRRARARMLGAQRVKARAARAADLVAFVCNRPGVPWPRLRREWNRQVGIEPFAETRSMRQMYRTVWESEPLWYRPPTGR